MLVSEAVDSVAMDTTVDAAPNANAERDNEMDVSVPQPHEHEQRESTEAETTGSITMDTTNSTNDNNNDNNINAAVLFPPASDQSDTHSESSEPIWCVCALLLIVLT